MTRLPTGRMISVAGEKIYQLLLDLDNRLMRDDEALREAYRKVRRPPRLDIEDMDDLYENFPTRNYRLPQGRFPDDAAWEAGRDPYMGWLRQAWRRRIPKKGGHRP